MSNENTNYGQSVTGVVIKDNKVLLARHTYESNTKYAPYSLYCI